MKVIYTCITGNYDKLIELPKLANSANPANQWQCVCFTDNPELKSSTWEIRPLVFAEMSAKKNHRWHKINSHILFPDADKCVYIDGNMELKNTVGIFLTMYFKGGFLTCKHPHRTDVLQEAEAIIRLNKDTSEIVHPFIDSLIGINGMPSRLFENGFIIRDNTNQKVIEINECWWQLLKNGSHRDQLTLPFADMMTGSKIQTTSTSYRNMIIKIHKHTPNIEGNFKIWYSNPYSMTKNIGGAINDFCRLVPSDDDWIVIQDGDIIYLTPDWGVKIHEAIKVHGSKYALLGCMTNRLNSLHQLHQHKRSDDHDIKNHFDIAKTYNENTCIDVTSKNIAGCWMAFKKSTWQKVGCFKENDIAFDTDFCSRVKRKGMKIGLINNLYVYHLYRIWSDNPQKAKEHLK